MKVNIVYVLSDTFDYSRLICDDAGPGYAQSMNWDLVRLSDLRTATFSVFVIDNRIEKAELPLLKNIIRQNPDTIFFLKIVDPYFENREHYYYQFAAEAGLFNNTFIFSVYNACELTAELRLKYNNRFIHLPYPYLQPRERDCKKRKNRILISGSINNIIYPYRYAIWKKVTRSFTRLLFFSILKHPGYIDLDKNQNHTHNIINNNYLAYLSNYKYMLMCPTHLRIELLKYNECFYAGCLPVGIAPDVYPEELKRLFLKLRTSNFLTDLRNIFLNTDKKQIVSVIRTFLRTTRNPEVLNNRLKEFILENPIYTS